MAAAGDSIDRGSATGEDEKPGVVRALRLEIVDQQGRVRVVIGELGAPHEDEPAFGLGLRDVERRPRLNVEVLAHGPSLTLDLGGNVVVELGVSDPGPYAIHVGPLLHLADRDGRPVAGWEVGLDGSVTAYEG